MDFQKLAKVRYSSRKYSSKQVEKDKIEAILEAGRVAPTAANKQPQRVIVVQGKDGLNKIGESANLYGAPLAFIVCGNTKEAWTRPVDNKNFADIDASVVTAHMMMQASELSLGNVWIGIFDPKSIKTLFNLPPEVEPVSILAVGYAEDGASPDRHGETRKAIAETVFNESYGN